MTLSTGSVRFGNSNSSINIQMSTCECDSAVHDFFNSRSHTTPTFGWKRIDCRNASIVSKGADDVDDDEDA